MRIERVQHAGNRPVVDGFIRVHWLGVVLFDEGVHIGELLEAVLNLRVSGHGRLLAGTLGKNDTQETASQQEKNYQEE